jgi:6-phosphogluconolactonase
VVKSKNGTPCFDLILLGMGDDGHTASLFPNQSDIVNSTKLCESAFVPVKKQTRITLTPRCINNATKVAFQITGMAKSAIVNEILLKHDKCQIYPAAHIKPVSSQLYWFLDAGAAKGLLS